MPISHCIINPRGWSGNAPRSTYVNGQVQIWMQLSQEKYSVTPSIPKEPQPHHLTNVAQKNFLESFAERRPSDVSFASQRTRRNHHDSVLSTASHPTAAVNGVTPYQSSGDDAIPYRLVILIAETAQQKSRYITLDCKAPTPTSLCSNS
jgi:hypothetical protein